MIEKAISFGPGGALSAITTEPAAGGAVAGAPAVIFWNVGINHHVGPYRVNVDLARSLASIGVTSLRFDLSGMGDSEVRPGAAAGDLERAMDDVRDAMTWLEKRKGARTFVLVGFCSSVDATHALAVADPRVVGACFLEGFAFRTRGFYARYPLRLLERGRWRRLVVNNARRYARETATRAIGGVQDEKAALTGSVYTRDYPPPATLRRDYEALAARGVALLFVFTGGDGDFNHVSQFDEMLGTRALRASGKVEVEYYGDVDHTFFHAAHRERVLARVRAWFKGRLLAL